MRVNRLLTTLIVLLSIALVDAPVVAATSSIRLTARPSAIYADGRSVTAISAEVRDSSGNLAPDGTEVRFSSSLGIIDTSANTIAGVARVTLRSGTQSGIAMISAVLPTGEAISQTQVEILPPGSQIDSDAFLTISSSRYLAYAVDSQTVDATGGCRIEHRGLVIEAGDTQIEVMQNLLRAKAKTGEYITMTRGSKSLTASVLMYDLNIQRGVIVAEGADGRLAKLRFNGADLTTIPFEDELDQAAFEFADLSETQMLVKAREITLRPRREVQFKKAEVYMQGGKVLKLPLYLLPLTGDPTRGPQYIGFTSAGLRVDLPLYYSLTPSGAGALRIRNQQGGWSRYSTSSGWALDLEQSYATGGSEGRFTVGQVNSRDWGVDWEHSQQLGLGSRLHTYIGVPAHRDLFGTMSFNKSLRSSSLGVNLRGTKYQDQPGSMAGDVYLQSRPKQLAKIANYSVAARSSFSNEHRDGYSFGNGLQLHLYSNPIKLGRTASFNSSVSFGQDWGQLNSGFSVFGNALLMTRFGSHSNLGLGYTYTQDSRSFSDYGKHRLSLNYMSYGDKWQSSLSTIYTLDYPITSAYGSIGYRFNEDWRLNLRGTYHKFGISDFGDLEMGLGRRVGSQDVELIWSQSLKRFRLEFGSLSF